MRIALLFSLLLLGPALLVAQNTPKPAAPAGTGTAKPAPTQPRTPPARGAQPGRGGLALVVTAPSGATLPEVTVAIDGPTPRTGVTNESGQINFPGLQPGTYRLRFGGDKVTAFEREVAVRAGNPTTLDIMLNPAPPPREIIKEAPAPPPAPAVPAGPPGDPQVLSLVDLAERELDRKQPRRETLVSCSVRTRSTLLQLNQDQPERLYEEADSLFYVIAGEGVLRIDGRETKLSAGSFASVPRDTSFTLGRRGRNPLILLSVLSGEPCEEAK
jgi:mannose-6-phosphate isomerase-like protein (cupin superfamily)